MLSLGRKRKLGRKRGRRRSAPKYRFLHNWKLEFRLDKKAEGMRNFVNLIMSREAGIFVLPQSCLIRYVETLNGEKYRHTSWVIDFSVIHLSNESLAWGRRLDKLVLAARTESGSLYYLTGNNLDPDFKEELIQYRFPKDFLS